MPPRNALRELNIDRLWEKVLTGALGLLILSSSPKKGFDLLLRGLHYIQVGEVR